MENEGAFIVDSSKDIFRVVIFSYLEAKGYYRYADEFQIYPYVDTHIPKSDIQSYFPLILEYKREAGKDDIRTMGRSLFSKQDRIIALLNTFTNNLFFKPEVTTQLGYKIADMESGEKLNLHWFIPITGSQYEGLPFLNQFTNPAVEMMKSIQHRSYYYHFPDLQSDDKQEFKIPDTLTRIFDSYFKKTGNTRDFLNTATDYVSNAVELFAKHKTLSFISSYTAIEAMVNLEFKNSKAERCKDCNQLKFSVRKKFVAYLLKYIGVSLDNEKLFKKYYDRRSDIIHKGDRLKTEKYFNTDNEDEANNEHNLRAEILQLSRLAVTNWLLHNCDITSTTL